MRRPALRPASDANPFTTNHRILNHTIPKNPAAASHHARGLAIAPERKYRFIQNSENVTVSSRTQSPRDMTSRPSNTHIMTINHVPGLRPDATQNLRSNTEPQKGATLPITGPTMRVWCRLAERPRLAPRPLFCRLPGRRGGAKKAGWCHRRWSLYPRRGALRTRGRRQQARLAK